MGYLARGTSFSKYAVQLLVLFSDESGYGGTREMLSDRISVSILEFFVKENPTFERSLLLQFLELYTRSRNASIIFEMEGLPDV